MIEGTKKIARPVFWTKFVRGVAMDLDKRLVEVNFFKPIDVHAL